jgi:hypothetical protein
MRALLVALALCGIARADTATPGARPGGERCLRGEECASGLCEGAGCDDRTPGRCAAVGRVCPRNHVPFCGCDGETFYQSSACPGRRYRHAGECEIVGCEAPSPAVQRELKRLLATAERHATLSHVCVDGSGEKTALALLEACVRHPAGRPNEDVIGLVVWMRYRVIVEHERGGECSPYPECAKSPPPAVSVQSVELRFSGGPDGFTMIVPVELPGVPLKTPLAKKHSTGCYGESPAFVPGTVK